MLHSPKQTVCGSGKPKAVWVLNPHRPHLHLHLAQVSASTLKFKEQEFGGGINYDSGHVGWTSISNFETCPNV